MESMSERTRRYRLCALAANLGLLAWVVLWNLSLSPHPHLNAATLAVVWAIPLLLPLPGILAGKPYTHAWANFVLMLYFLHSLTVIYIDEGERWFGAAELFLTSVAFICNIMFARLRGKELGLKLKKLSEVEKTERSKYHTE
ncbi:DUF2069 domain-containing protein [Vibrio astriarenae]|uniref:DUF2069 domain-containing protein n=1 Tax=Vibrio astriarenae TaxID=1481923 RepID=UPI003736F6B3